jgi:hypothetical protein
MTFAAALSEFAEVFGFDGVTSFCAKTATGD